MNQRKLTICYFAAANSIHTKRWVEYFADRGHNVHLFSFVQNNEIKGVKQHLIERKFKINMRVVDPLINLLFILSQIRRIIKEVKPDILHAHDVTDYGRLAALAGFHPLVITPWGSDIFFKRGTKSKIKKFSLRYGLKKADLITSDGDNTIKELINNFDILPEKIKYIRFGTDTEKFRKREKEKNRNSKVVISSRTTNPYHNSEILVKAAPIVLERFPEAKFIIIGGDEASQYRKYVIDLSKSLGLESKIEFTGNIPSDKVVDYFNMADIYASACLSDSGISSSATEAMSCNLPVIITDIADHRSWVKDGENGFIISGKDIKEVAEKIIYLFSNEEKRLDFGRAARKIIEERNDYRKEMAKMEKEYMGLVKL